ncbi:hypothetical protein [Novosphingobium sp.]|uniref:hypothetical protein n=1 Tax=Novosphingobium sp. TaxID=1874826 RepID=UPI0038B9F7ED
MSGSRVVGWKLSEPCRARLLDLFPPRHARLVADHVTLHPFAGVDAVPPPALLSARIVGHADDGTGVEALVVAIDGSTERPGGGTWHVTWSLAEGRRARDSNDLLGRGDWRLCDGGAIELLPAVW